MISRYSFQSGKVPSFATGVLLLALVSASLGCALAACFGVADVTPSPRAATVVPRVDRLVAAAAIPVTQAIAHTGEALRCSPAQAARARRLGQGACRLAEMPSV
jgi:hypothetical protein